MSLRNVQKSMTHMLKEQNRGFPTNKVRLCWVLFHIESREKRQTHRFPGALVPCCLKQNFYSRYVNEPVLHDPMSRVDPNVSSMQCSRACYLRLLPLEGSYVCLWGWIPHRKNSYPSACRLLRGSFQQ